MDRETLLDDAIAKAKETEDWQLVEWLRMARGGKSAVKWYTERLRELEDENARLRSCLSDDAENARMIMGENDRLRELVRDWHALATGGADSLTDWNHEQADLERRMRELGVEADG